MTPRTFTQLYVSVADWLQRDDLTAQIPKFLNLAKSKMYQGDLAPGSGMADIQPLRITPMIAGMSVTPSSGVFSIATQLGTGWLEFIDLKPSDTNAHPLKYLDPWAFDAEVTTSSCPAVYYTIKGYDVYLSPICNSPINVYWYRKLQFLDVLSDDGPYDDGDWSSTAPVSDDGDWNYDGTPLDSDWLMAHAPHVYLDGCMMEACAYLEDDRESMFRAKFASSIRGLNQTHTKGRTSGSRLIARPRVVV